jgi:MerR family transcriptional regulator, copper efflux regulator
MRITEAAQQLGTSPRMLRYRDLLGLLPPVREPAPARRRPTRRTTARHPGARGAEANHRVTSQVGAGRARPDASRPAPGRPGPALVSAIAPGSPRHRQFGDDDLAAVALALQIEQRYDISPAALAFGLRVLTEPGVRAEVAELGRRIGRIGPLPARALEFEKQRALRLLNLAPRRRPEG